MPAMRQNGEQLDLLQGQGAGYLSGPLQGLQIFCRDYAVVLLVRHKARSAEGKAESGGTGTTRYTRRPGRGKVPAKHEGNRKAPHS